MSVGVSHQVKGGLRYSWHLPNPASCKEVHKALGWAEDVAKEVGVDRFDNWLMLRYDEEENELEFYFEVDLGRLGHNERLRLLESQQRRTDATPGTAAQAPAKPAGPDR